MSAKTIKELVMEYFYAHPNEDLEHGPVVDWVTKQWLESHDTPRREPWCVIRALHQKGVLIKVKKAFTGTTPKQLMRVSRKILHQSKRKKSSDGITIVA